MPGECTKRNMYQMVRLTMAEPQEPGPRQPESARDRLLAAAVAIAMQGGIADLSLRELAAAIGTDVKGRASNLMYGLGIGLSFANRWTGLAAYVAVALIWFIPDRRVERTLSGPHEDRGRIPP